MFKFKIIGYAFCAILSFNATAQTYNEVTRQLTLPNVQVGNVSYSNVVIRLNSFDVLAASGPMPNTAPVFADNCDNTIFTMAKFNAIQKDMSRTQVNQIIGCNLTFSNRIGETNLISWLNYLTNQQILVYFNNSDKANNDILNPGGLFKVSRGL